MCQEKKSLTQVFASVAGLKENDEVKHLLLLFPLPQPQPTPRPLQKVERDSTGSDLCPATVRRFGVACLVNRLLGVGPNSLSFSAVPKSESL